MKGLSMNKMLGSIKRKPTGLGKPAAPRASPDYTATIHGPLPTATPTTLGSTPLTRADFV